MTRGKEDSGPGEGSYCSTKNTLGLVRARPRTMTTVVIQACGLTDQKAWFSRSQLGGSCPASTKAWDAASLITPRETSNSVP